MPRNTVFSVYDVLELLDSTGISIGKRKRLRKRQYVSKGPNYVWHIDFYNKLKPYSIVINGCIFGFSRNFTWLEANTTNSDPRVIASTITCIHVLKLWNASLAVRSGYVMTLELKCAC